MDPLTGVNVTASGLLALGGALKIARPRPAAEALGSLAPGGRRGGPGAGRSAGRIVPLPLMRCVGVAEVVIAAGALAVGGTGFFFVQMLCFVAFTVVATALWREGEVSSCGCFGEVTSPPSLAHVLVTAAATLVSARAAWVDAPGLLDEAGRALPVLVAGLTTLGLVYLCLVDLPRLTDAVRQQRRLREEAAPT